LVGKIINKQWIRFVTDLCDILVGPIGLVLEMNI